MSRKIVRTKCIACGNSVTSSQRFHGLPKNEERRKKWLVLLNREDAIELDKQFLNNNVRVCSNHFQDWAFSSSLKDRLIRNALPNSDPPPSYPIIESKLCEVVKKPQYRVLKLSRAHIEELKKKQGKIIWNRNDTTKPSRLSTSRKNGHSEQPSLLTSIDVKGEQPSSPVSVDGNCDQLSLPAIKVENSEQPNLSFSVIKHSKPSLRPLTGEYKLGKKIFTKRAQQDQSHLHQTIATQRKEIYNQRSMIKKLRKKLDALTTENLNFHKTVMDKLNTERYGFLKSLIKQLGTKKVGGMRWSDKDKEFANACYVLSPKVYKMLRYKLGFPSKSTICRISGAGKPSKPAKQAPRVENQVCDESNGAVNRMSESNGEINRSLDESNESFIQMSESGGTLQVDESSIAVNHLMGQGQTLQVSESTGAFFQFIESMETMNESQVQEVVEIIESVP